MEEVEAAPQPASRLTIMAAPVRRVSAFFMGSFSFAFIFGEETLYRAVHPLLFVCGTVALSLHDFMRL